MKLRKFIDELQTINTRIQRGKPDSLNQIFEKELVFVPHFQMNQVNVDGDDEDYQKGWLTIDSEVLGFTIEENAVLVEIGNKEDA